MPKIYAKANYIFVEIDGYDHPLVDSKFNTVISPKGGVDNKYLISSELIGDREFNFSEITDENGSSYSQIDWDAFWQNSTGFSLASASDALGWAQYNDGQYTEGSPLSISTGVTATLNIDGTNTIKSQLPSGIDDLYDVNTSKVLPVKVGDGFAFSLGFKAKSTSNNGRGSIFIDIGDGSRLFERLIQFPRGQNIQHPFFFSTNGYQLNNFFANGGIIKYAGEVGTTTIYDITLQVHRLILGK